MCRLQLHAKNSTLNSDGVRRFLTPLSDTDQFTCRGRVSEMLRDKRSQSSISQSIIGKLSIERSTTGKSII